MAEPPELWAFLLVNSLLFLVGGVLTVFSYRAYLRVRRRSLRGATVGFALITLGGLLELIYQFGIRRGYELGGRELLAIQTLESGIIAAGLVVIFYTLSKY